MFCGIYLRAISQEVLMNLVQNICSVLDFNFTITTSSLKADLSYM